MNQAEIERTLTALLTRHYSSKVRRKIGELLIRLGQQQFALADAEERETARPAAARLAPKKRGAGPGRTPGDFVRIERIAPPPPKGQSQDRNVEQSALNRKTVGQPRVTV